MNPNSCNDLLRISPFHRNGAGPRLRHWLAFTVGITLIGIPAWHGLHRLELSGPQSLPAAGGMLSVLGGIAAMPQSFPVTPLLIPGGVAGWIIWKVGYKQP
ncbi:hypothetical protein OB03_06185 [Brevundimonas sp. GN22]